MSFFFSYTTFGENWLLTLFDVMEKVSLKETSQDK